MASPIAGGPMLYPNGAFRITLRVSGVRYIPRSWVSDPLDVLALRTDEQSKLP